MKVVVDVGCGKYDGKYDSMERLIVMHSPQAIYGLDPNPDGAREAAFWMPKRAPDDPLAVTYVGDRRGIHLTIVNAAAWTHDGQIGFRADGLSGWSAASSRLPQVPCVDLAAYCFALLDRHEIDGERPQLIVKLDCEGAEYDLIPHLRQNDLDPLIDTLMVEWHPQTANDDRPSRKAIEKSWEGELLEWLW